MTGRYCYCPMTAKKITMRLTLRDRLNRWWNRKHKKSPDVYMVTGYFQPIWIRH